MAADPNDPRTRQTDPTLGPRREPPPKPIRPHAAPAVEDDDTTIRFLLGEEAEASQVVPRAAPLVNAPSGGEQAPASAFELLKGRALRLLAAKPRVTKIGAAIFGAGVLVGVVGSVVVMTSHPPRKVAASANTPAAVALLPAAIAPRPTPSAAPTAAPLEHAGALASARVDEEIGSGRRVEAPAPEPVFPLISSSFAPSCRQLLRGRVAERNDPRAAQRETRAGNRQLLLGNVNQAQAAYCKAFLWDHGNVERHVSLGQLFLVRRDWKKAAEFGQSALELDPKNRRALSVVGDAWAALHKTDEAREAWLAFENKSALSAKDVDLIVRRNMALARRVEQLKDFSLAERIYRRVLVFSPEHSGATKGVANSLLKAGDYPAAQAWARRAEELKQRQ